jgi:predicted nuclease of predicted toxin-antitoxin system
VKVKLDENIPLSVVGMLVERGHDVDTVVAENLTAAADETIVQAAAAAGRLLLTLDRGVGDLRRHPAGSHGGIVVLRLHDQSAAAVRRIVDQLTETQPRGPRRMRDRSSAWSAQDPPATGSQQSLRRADIRRGAERISTGTSTGSVEAARC